MTQRCDCCARRASQHVFGAFRLCSRCAAEARAAPTEWAAIMRVCHGVKGLHRVRVRFDSVQQCPGCGQRGRCFSAVGVHFDASGQRRMYVACEECARAADRRRAGKQ